MNCPHCSHVFYTLRSASRGASYAAPGAMVLCPTCGRLSIIESSALFGPDYLRPMTTQEFSELDSHTKADLNHAMHCIIDKAKAEGLTKIIDIDTTRTKSEPDAAA